MLSGNCYFKEHSNDKDLFMKNSTSRFVVVHAVHSMSPSDELFINYNFCRQANAQQKRLALGLPLDIPLGCKKNIIK